MEEISNNNINTLKSKVREVLEREFLLAKDNKPEINIERMYEIHENGLKHLFMLYIDNLDVFKEYRGKSLDHIMDKHLKRFRHSYDFHRKMAKCNEFDEVRKSLFDDDSLKKIQLIVNKRIEEFFYLFKDEFSKLSLKENMDMHFFVIQTIVDLDIEHVPCFKESAKRMNLQVVLNIHKREFDKIFKQHIK